MESPLQFFHVILLAVYKKSFHFITFSIYIYEEKKSVKEYNDQPEKKMRQQKLELDKTLKFSYLARIDRGENR